MYIKEVSFLLFIYATTYMTEDIKPTRRGPGRPPRRILAPLTVKGIVDEPECEDNIMEFCYYDPSIFKYLFSLFKNLKVRDIYLIFTPTEFLMLTQDHIGNRILINIECSKIIHYYCKPEDKQLCLLVNKDNIQTIFLNLNKNIDRTTFSYERGDDMLQIRLDNSNLGKIETRNVLICLKTPDEELYSVINEITTKKSVIKFSLPIREFKETVCSVCCYGDRFRIEKHGNGPLTIAFSRTHTNNCTDEFTDPEKIMLIHSITDNQSFSCHLYAMLLKAIAVSIINSKVDIQCYDNNIALISSTISDICTFHIMAERNET